MALKEEIIEEIKKSDLSPEDKKDFLNQIDQIWSFEDSLPNDKE